ncbi:MAG: 2Fe-2S iron-sulfur cluster-binding protein [Actinobacteria bacterium]|nr:2Fe-2S iron-sulfur cluster-binding protein [Actinomycetota bacterium]
MDNVNLTINGRQVSAPAGSTILDAAVAQGIFIPTFCHDPNLPGVASCRICVVEVKGQKNLTPSCMTAVREGMVVETESPAVVEARKTILELILANHPQDCLTCEKNGDCRLQDYAFIYGVKEGGFTGERHNYAIEEDNPYIIRDMNKCILCGKCVRTCAQVEGRAVIDYAFRGFRTKVAPPMNNTLGDSDCVYCGRCVAVCPVGALLYKPMAGKGRTWEIAREPVTCSFCESGCQFYLNKKGGRVIGVSAGSPGLGRPLCLKGRLGMELLYCDDPVTPQLKKGDVFQEVSWAEALGLKGVIDKIKKLEGE